MPRKTLTAAFVATVRPDPGGAQTDYFDAGLPAFGVRVGARRKTWFVVTMPRTRRPRRLAG